MSARSRVSVNPDDVARLYSMGVSMKNIGERYGVSRQYIHKVLKIAGAKGAGGSAKVKAARKALHDAAYMDRYSLTKDEHDELVAMGRDMMSKGKSYHVVPIGAFIAQRYEVKRRDVHWGLLLGDWWAVWKASGKWDRRGKGMYVMARLDREKGFIPGNVRITIDGQLKSDRDIPAGVTPTKPYKDGKVRYEAFVSRKGKRVYLGVFEDPKRAGDVARAARFSRNLKKDREAYDE